MADSENALEANQDVEVVEAEGQQQHEPASKEQQYTGPPIDNYAANDTVKWQYNRKKRLPAIKPADVDRTTDVSQEEDMYDANGDGITDDEMFEGSTHSFAIYFGSKRNISGLIIAYFVIVMQMVMYCVCLNQVVGDLSGDQFIIPVHVRFGKECTTASNLVCTPDLPNLGYVALVSVLLAFFLFHDIIAGIRVWFTIPGIWAKLAGFIIVFEALFAVLIGSLFAVQANSRYDAIASCVAILFIHNADEKAFKSFLVIEAVKLRAGKYRQNSCMACCCRYNKLASLFITAFIIILVFVFIFGRAIKASIRSQISDIYGQYYFEDNFGSGGYMWDWASGGSAFTPSPTPF